MAAHGAQLSDQRIEGSVPYHVQMAALASWGRLLHGRESLLHLCCLRARQHSPAASVSLWGRGNVMKELMIATQPLVR